MEAKEGLYATLDAAAGIERYDAACKKLFAKKEILAYILKRTVSEYANLSETEIMALIEQDTIHWQTTEVSPDMTNTVKGENTESTVIGEATARFDLLFHSRLPGGENLAVNLLIDFEVQKDYRPGYPVINRGVYYASREISMQLQKVSGGETGYSHLQKVYSIWVCVQNIPKELENSISYYGLKNYRNVNCAPQRDGDLMEIVILRLGEGSTDNHVLDMLHSIFDGDREKLLSYIPYADTGAKKEVTEMVSFGTILLEKGEKKGEEKVLLRTAKNLLDAGIDENIVVSCTGLSLEKVRELKEKEAELSMK